MIIVTRRILLVAAVAAALFGPAHFVGQVKAEFVLNLTTAGANGSLSTNDYFTNTDTGSTGSGTIQSFVRIQKNTNVVHGYNTSARPTQFDENSSPTFTRDLPMSIIPIVNIGGVNYREFFLDINQNKGLPSGLLTLNELQVFIGNTGVPIGATVDGNGTLNFGSQASLIYDLDAGPNGDSRIDLNYNLQGGSGNGDLFVYLRDSLFSGGTYVTLYSKFGNPYENNDGYEEWAVRTTVAPPPPVPAPATFILAATGILGLGLVRARRMFRRRSVNE